MSMSLSNGWPVKAPVADPAATLDYLFDVSGIVLDGNGNVVDTIVSVSAQVKPSGAGELAVAGGPAGQSLFLVNNTLTVWLQGGVPGRGSYLLYLIINTSVGRVYGFDVIVPISGSLAMSPVPEPPNSGLSTPVVWYA